jgi:hypothetical protein
MIILLLPIEPMKKFLKYTGISLLALLLIIFLIPVFFKSKILAVVKEEINHNIEAKVDFKDLSISWFSNFPKLTLALEDITVIGKGDFESDTLLSATSLDAAVNIMSIIRQKDMKIYSVFLQSPRVHAIVNKEGRANWDIAQADTTATIDSLSAFQFNLEKYEISDGFIVYDDRQAGMLARIEGLNHKGSGDFNQDLFMLSTSTAATSASFMYAGIPYLAQTKTNINADIEINNQTSTYSFKNAGFLLNDLMIKANGFFQLVNDSTYNMDISFDAPSNEFRNILSLVPAIYKNDFGKIKTSGQASFKGFVKGKYSSTELPAYDVDMNISDGFFQYPDLPKPVKNIQVAARFSNVDGKMDNTVVDIKNAHLEFGDAPFDFKLLFRNPETYKYLDLLVKGNLDLAEVSKFVKLEPGTTLSGMLNADAFAKGNLSALEAQKGPFSAGGFFNIRQFNFSSKDLPFPIKKGSFDIGLKNDGGVADATSINISSGHIEMGEDAIDFALKLDKPVTAMIFSGKAKGGLSLDKVQKFTTLEPGTSIKGMVTADMNFSGSKADIDKGNYEKINLNGSAGFSNIGYTSKEYPEGVQIHSAQLGFSAASAELHSLKAKFQNTNFTASGILNNLIAYALDKGSLKGTVNVSADRIQLNQWMGTQPANTENNVSATEPFLVPANIDLVMNAKAGNVEYDKVQYNNVSGKLLLKDETVQLRDVYTEALDGQVNFNGSYSTRTNKVQPEITMDYSMKEVSIQKAFMAFNRMQQLMPLGKFLSGTLSSQFAMNGKLGADMLPNLATLTGKGNFLLIEGFLSKFQPLEKLASMLQVDVLKDVSLRDVKTYFEFANGKVLVKPFTLKVKDIDMVIGGTHGLDQSMDYILALHIPRSYLGTAGNNLVNQLASAASQKGIQVNLSEYVDLNVRMTGSINNPSIKTDLKQAAGDMGNELKQQAVGFIQQKADSAKKVVTDSLTKVKDRIVDDAKKDILGRITGTKDSSGKSPSLDSTKKQAGEKVKGALNDLFKKKKPADN